MKVTKFILTLSLALSLCACGKKSTTKDGTKTKVTTKKTTWGKTTGLVTDYEKMTFGVYPQTLEKDETKISELNNLAGSLPTVDDFKAWTGYGYTNEWLDEYMWYIDIDENMDGTNDYRGIYFTKYIFHSPYDVYDSYGKQTQYGYKNLVTYWFKYEPIEWLVLKEESGKKLLLSNLVLNANVYNYETEFNKKFDHNGGYGYGNDYALSSIRLLLINDFYNLAFSNSDKSKILETLVDNSASHTATEDYESTNTNDKVFLLSYKEVKLLIKNESQRMADASDFAKIHGLAEYENNIGSWWIRGAVNECETSGFVNCYGGIHTEPNLHSETRGIRPAIWINAN